MAAMAEEDSKLMRATQKEYETAARERAVQSELEWQARSIGAKAADAARLAAVDALHMRSGALDLKAQAAHEAAAKVEAANAAKHAPAFAAAAAAKGQDLLGYDGLLVMGAAARAKAKLQRNELSDLGKKVKELVHCGLMCDVAAADVVRLLDVLGTQMGLAEGLDIGGGVFSHHNDAP